MPDISGATMAAQSHCSSTTTPAPFAAVWQWMNSRCSSRWRMGHTGGHGAHGVHHDCQPRLLPLLATHLGANVNTREPATIAWVGVVPADNVLLSAQLLHAGYRAEFREVLGKKAVTEALRKEMFRGEGRGYDSGEEIMFEVVGKDRQGSDIAFPSRCWVRSGIGQV